MSEILDMHQLMLEQSGGAPGLRDANALNSALAQPRMTFSGQDLYPGPANKAAALAFSLIMNHAFVDGNKRIGHAAMETFLVLNGYELDAPVDEQERVILQVAAGETSRDQLSAWVNAHVKTREST